MACFCVFFSVLGCMLCLVRYLFVISTSVIDCLGRFVPEMTYYVSSGTLNLAKLKLSVMPLVTNTRVVFIRIHLLIGFCTVLSAGFFKYRQCYKQPSRQSICQIATASLMPLIGWDTSQRGCWCLWLATKHHTLPMIGQDTSQTGSFINLHKSFKENLVHLHNTTPSPTFLLSNLLSL